MGLFGPSKKEITLQNELDYLKSMLSPEQNQVFNLHDQVTKLEERKKSLENAVEQCGNEIRQGNKQLSQLYNDIEFKKRLIYSLDDDLYMQEYGLYKPMFEFANSDLYMDRLKEIRNLQKECIKHGGACTGNLNWKVNGSSSSGKKMVQDMQKLLLRAFNVECDSIVNSVKISNVNKGIERIKSISEQISKLGKMMAIAISQAYINLKIDELMLALDYQQKKHEEKERIKELKEQQREDKKIQKEVEEARKKLQKEQTHYQNALSALMEQIQKSGETPDLLEKRNELEAGLNDTARAIADVDYREANKRAGYVYIISNIGAFGENVYKIGMTRRLEPLERIDELGDASVPFNFDVHALIFTEDAPSLESALHEAFESKKVNKINQRREFFNVTLDDIKCVVRKNFDKTVEWIDYPEAEQYRQSLLLKSHNDYSD